jgi:hypothetical protein
MLIFRLNYLTPGSESRSNTRSLRESKVSSHRRLYLYPRSYSGSRSLKRHKSVSVGIKRHEFFLLLINHWHHYVSQCSFIGHGRVPLLILCLEQGGITILLQYPSLERGDAHILCPNLLVGCGARRGGKEIINGSKTVTMKTNYMQWCLKGSRGNLPINKSKSKSRAGINFYSKSRARGWFSWSSSKSQSGSCLTSYPGQNH